MPAAPVLATHVSGSCIAPRRLGVRGTTRGGAPAASAEVAWCREVRAAGFALDITIETFEGYACIDAVVANPGDAPRALGAVVLGFEWSAPVSGALCFLRNGWQSDADNGPQLLDAAEPGESHQVCAMGVAGRGPCALIGAYECGRSFARVFARGVRGGASIDLELWVDALLAPGERRALETVEVAVGDDANALLEGFAARWGRAAGARTWRPLPTGWRSGHARLRDVSQDGVRRALEALVAAELPIEVVQLDDGYQRAIGDWLASAASFPRGLEPLAAEIRAAGFVPGLWTAPLCAEAGSDLHRDRPEWFLRDTDGSSSLRVPGDRFGSRLVFALDTSREAVTRHLEALYRTLVGWGFFHLNLDALGVAAHGDSSDLRVGPAERVRRGLAAVRRGAGDEAFLLASGCPLGPAVGLVDGMRIAPDPALPCARTSALARLWMHRRLWLNDPGPPPDGALGAALPHEAARAWAAVIAETGGIAFASGDLAAEVPAQQALLRETVAEVRALDARGLPGVARVARPLDPEAPPQVVQDEPARLATSPLAVFCDFDGTFSVQDVGSSLAVRFAAERRPAQWARYQRGEITPWEYNLEILDGLPVGTDVLDAFLASVELDPGARALIAWCGAQHVPFRILSDGFDWNLNRLQSLHRVRFTYTANRLRVEHGRWRIRAGAPDPTCGCGTGTCKGGILRAYRAERPGTHLVHVGNGRVSDTCGALAADTVFAKDTLADSLEDRGAPFVRFATLHDVIPHLAAILTRLAAA